MEPKKEFKKLLRKNGYTFSSFSKVIHTNRGTLQRKIENGTLTIKDLKEIAGLLNMEAVEILRLWL